MNKAQKEFYEARKTELIGKGWRAAMAEKRARKEARILSSAHRMAVARRLALADSRFNQTGELSAYEGI